MASILTPATLWDGFDDSADTSAEKIGERNADGIIFEDYYFYGRETGDGRVKIFGTFAYLKDEPVKETVLILPDSSDGVDEEVLKLFVNKGYSALMIDYRGEWEGAEHSTVYPENISYANTIKCGRYKDFVDESADKTSWYEWVAVSIYARKFALERSGSDKIAIVGLRDGGEIAWKLAAIKKFACAVPVCAAGWLAYAGISKYISDEQSLDSERFRFIAGIDSQAYAPYVKCPIILLCSTNDARLDYDRAYDTFSRINPEFAESSVIVYSVLCDSSIGMRSTTDMFLFLEKYLKSGEVYVPQPVDINVTVDGEQNLVAVAKYDDQVEIAETGMFISEDCPEPSARDWSLCFRSKKTDENVQTFYLDIYEDTSTLFVLGYAKYVNGFTVWSKISVKKISGRFKNMKGKERVIFSSRNGADGFYISDPRSIAIGGIFFTDGIMAPQIVTKAKGIKGIYSEQGLTTYRLSSPKYSPKKGNILKLDVFCDETAEITFALVDLDEKETYRYSQSVLGGVWQSLILESKLFKNVNGAQLSDFVHNMKFCISSDGRYAINNILWL